MYNSWSNGDIAVFSSRACLRNVKRHFFLDRSILLRTCVASLYEMVFGLQTGLILTYTLEIGVPILLPEYHNRMQHAKVWYLCFS
jgi:hypothetical protein